MIAVHVNVGDRRDVPSDLVERALRETLAREGVGRAELSVTFLSDGAMARMHAESLGRSGPADVLSFALHEPGEQPLGDIYVGADQAVRQAEEAGVGASEEMARLAVHGALHVLGYDHPDGPERTASEMFRVQEEVLACVSVPGRQGAA